MSSFSTEILSNNEYSYQLASANRIKAGIELRGTKNNSLNEVGNAP